MGWRRAHGVSSPPWGSPARPRMDMAWTRRAWPGPAGGLAWGHSHGMGVVGADVPRGTPPTRTWRRRARGTARETPCGGGDALHGGSGGLVARVRRVLAADPAWLGQAGMAWAPAGALGHIGHCRSHGWPWWAGWSRTGGGPAWT